MAEFRMPSLGADMESGTLVKWLKKPGDRVARGDIIAVVDTEKAAIEIEVFQTGTVETLLVEPGQKIPVGTPMALIRAEGEAAAAPPAAIRAAPPPAAVAAAPAPAPAAARAPAQVMPPPAKAGVKTGLRISPAARKRAAELGMSIETLTGTGPDGAVTLADVEHAAPAPAKTMRDIIAGAMARSKREIPHYYIGNTLDLEPALRWLEAENAKRPVPERMLYGALLLKAVALTLRDYPDFNGFWSDGRFKPSERIHIGVAI